MMKIFNGLDFSCIHSYTVDNCGHPKPPDKIPQICKVGMVEANIIKMLMTEVQMIGEGGGDDAEPDQQLLVPSSG